MSKRRLNIVIPMAGAGNRFLVKGYSTPKPLIEIDGVPMIRIVINNIVPSIPHRFIFVCQRSHNNEYGLVKLLESWVPGCIVLSIDGLSEGPASTVLAARDYIDTKDPLMITNSDQWIDTSVDDYLKAMYLDELDGYIMTMNASDPKWSFVEVGSRGLVTRVVEKEAISNQATVGVYNFRYGEDFVLATQNMIKKNLRVNNEFYVAPVFNELILRGARIGVYNIGSVGDGMHGLGTPEDLDLFVRQPVKLKALRGLL
jgi:dTDP-glucose pyrophosphorylase